MALVLDIMKLTYEERAKPDPFCFKFIQEHHVRGEIRGQRICEPFVTQFTTSVRFECPVGTCRQLHLERKSLGHAVRKSSLQLVPFRDRSTGFRHPDRPLKEVLRWKSQTWFHKRGTIRALSDASPNPGADEQEPKAGNGRSNTTPPL